MQVGVQLPQLGERATRDLVLRHARAAEASGWDALWVNDHVVFPREWRSPYPYSPDGVVPPRTTVDHAILEPLTELAFAAGATETIGLGTAVLVLNYRHAVLAAKLIASLGTLAEGRFVLGAGMGWAREEMEVLGMPSDRRGARFEASLRVIRRFLDEDWVDGLDTGFHAIDGWTARPRPARRVPIWIGGDSPQQLRRVGEIGDGWLAHAGHLGRTEDSMAAAREAAERAGRDPASLVVAMNGVGILAADRLEQTAERLHAARESGVGHAIVGLHPREIEAAPDLAERFAADYLASVRGG